MIRNIGIWAIAAATVMACSKSAQIPVIEVPRTSCEIIIDGQRNEADWNRATSVSQFINPWNEQVNPYTAVDFCWNGDDLFFLYEVYDDELVVEDKFKGEKDLSKEDRVEFFFSANLPLTNYYAIEMDPLGRVLDYKVAYYRNFDDSWNAGDNLKLVAQQTSKGYVIEGCIKAELLKELTGGKPTFYLGAYRAELTKDLTGKRIENWLCIRNPHLEIPDFHVSETFCEMRLQINK